MHDERANRRCEPREPRVGARCFEQRLREESDKLGLDPRDEALLADARKDLGPAIMRDIRYRAFRPLSVSHLHRAVPRPAAD